MAKIKSIKRKQIENERLMNLAVKVDESFVGNEIVLHNCKSYLRANLKTSKGVERLEILPLAPSANAIKSITL